MEETKRGAASGPKPVPKPSILDGCDCLGAFSGEKRWVSKDGSRIYTWDKLHGEIEVFNRRGHHLGAIDPIHGNLIKPAVKGRTINV
ncbi:colicin E3/pyocin S6 family cytotoxin [Nitrospira sp. NS4]|uniref:colicin E3/pyocin S6 family cytotoxin n=1 Tax=Nitrospira sp. NS4 TaxID=3414498 RepID=UPI003C2ACF92